MDEFPIRKIKLELKSSVLWPFDFVHSFHKYLLRLLCGRHQLVLNCDDDGGDTSMLDIKEPDLQEYNLASK